MSWSRTVEFSDPYEYQSALRNAELEILITKNGTFISKLTQVSLPRLFMHRCQETLPRILHGAICADRAPISFLTDANQPAIRNCGIEVSFGEIIVNDEETILRQTEGNCRWGAMSLPREDLLAAGIAIAGRELTVPSLTHIIRPRRPIMLRLLNLHKQAAELARTSPQNLEHAEIAKSLEQELVHSMVRCLTDAMPNEIGYRGHQHLKIMRRLEEYLVAHSDRSMYLAEICAEVGVSERTLRICCEEQLGIGPIRFLWLRRMHLAHRALLQAEPKIATVTDIATKFGFWEFGRFSVEHRELFGELPSHSLRRPPADRRVSDGDPFALAAAEFA